MSNNYRDLNVWKKAIQLVKMIYKASQNFPKSEIYGLTSQIRRAAVSVPSNVAEGQMRGTKTEFKRFLDIAKGSLAELETQVTIAKELDYIKGKVESELLEESNHIIRMLQNLKKSLS